MNTLSRRFAELDMAHPEIWQLFERFTFELIRRGFQRYSADAVMHRVRWETAAALDDGQGYKIANIWVAFYARKFNKRHPKHIGFFRLRPSIADQP